MFQRDESGISESFDLDSLTVGDRLRLFSFTQRDDHLAYLWVLRAMNVLRAVHQLQVHPDDVASALSELAKAHDEVPSAADLNLRAMLDNLSGDNEQVLYRVEDAARCGNLAAYRNRQSVYQFTEIGYRVYCAVEEVIGSRVQDANLSRLVFADILADFKALAAANREGDRDEVYRKLARLDSVLEDMTQRAARFYLTLNDVARTTDISPETFLRYKHALLAHMSEFTAELERYAPRLAEVVYEVEDSGVETLLERAAAVDERPMMRPAARLEDWRRRWMGLRQWFLAEGAGETKAAQLQGATRTAISGVIALLRQVTESRRGGVSRTTQLRHLAAWAAGAPDEQAANALVSAAFDLRSVRHLSGAHDDDDQISPRTTWWDAPGVEVSISLFRHGKRPAPGGPQPVRTSRGAHARLREQQLADRAADREAATDLLDHGPHDRVLNAAETRAVLKLLTRALQARTIVAGRLRSGTGSSDVLTLRLVPRERGSQLRTETGTLHLPGFTLEIKPHGAMRRRRSEMS
ncbi:TIGR02677 family protein [Streptomyces laculatispora]|uniref:TIGR02677 family protein n=1 Tax=Streptomyces laculatispora TaxID=887464 RepID=UPI001A949602|nr:TIGR02677 family protein [Streptomyces laculatispora]MBO0916647.1 TIGR02677 family protein [Streptomyces laculatispora]